MTPHPRQRGVPVAAQLVKLPAKGGGLANRPRAAIVFGSSRKARHWPARRPSAGSVEGVPGLFRERSLLGKTANRHFLAESSHPWFSFSETTRANGPEEERRLPGPIASSSSRSEPTFNPLRNLDSRKEKAFGFCCAGLGFRCGRLGFWCLRLGFWCPRLGNQRGNRRGEERDDRSPFYFGASR